MCFLLKIVSLRWLSCSAVYNDNPVMLEDSKSKSSNYYGDFASVGTILRLVRVDGGKGGNHCALSIHCLYTAKIGLGIFADEDYGILF